MFMATELSEWLFKLESNTLEEIRQQAIFAQLKLYLLIFLHSMVNGMDLKA